MNSSTVAEARLSFSRTQVRRDAQACDLTHVHCGRELAREGAWVGAAQLSGPFHA